MAVNHSERLPSGLFALCTILYQPKIIGSASDLHSGVTLCQSVSFVDFVLCPSQGSHESRARRRDKVEGRKKRKKASKAKEGQTTRERKQSEAKESKAKESKGLMMALMGGDGRRSCDRILYAGLKLRRALSLVLSTTIGQTMHRRGRMHRRVVAHWAATT